MAHRAIILNPAAGGGRAGRKFAPWRSRLESDGKGVRVYRTTGPGDASKLAQQAAEAGADEIIAVGGDGTLFEVVNGLFPKTKGRRTPALGVLPLGTGNSFMRDFDLNTPEAALDAILAGKRRSCDLVHCAHSAGEFHYINLLSVGFTAEAGAVTNRRFKPLGVAGYIAAVGVCMVRLKHPVVVFQGAGIDRNDRRHTLITFSNSKYTGGQMCMAPNADPSDGKFDVVHVGWMHRRRFASCFPRIFQGTHVDMKETESHQTTHVAFDLDHKIDVMVDGEVLSLQLQTLDIVPGAVAFIA
ncbi:MAG: YegS/Rv2252/BmrU family lipid kinase [Rhodobacterales bacterium]|nr:YegS/Rv2252/BmrU family lipid kinase [Rhodobacterales bacterium]